MRIITSSNPICKEPKELISHSELKRLLHYDPETGQWRWKIALSPRTKIGRPLRVNRNDGYVQICIRGVLYLSPRLAWFYMTGEWPPAIVDHKNTVRSDDRWENFRLATKAQNAWNAKVRSDSTSGLKGVQKSSKNRWQSKFRRKHLGTFTCPAAAHFAYLIEAAKHYGEFARAR